MKPTAKMPEPPTPGVLWCGSVDGGVGEGCWGEDEKSEEAGDRARGRGQIAEAGRQAGGRQQGQRQAAGSMQA